MLTGKKLHAFGDSFTWGDGFPDCHHLTGSSRVYPHKLANHYGMELVLHAGSGSSPLAQYNRFILNYDRLEAGDLVTFLWPYSMRSVLYQDTDIFAIDPTGPWELPEILVLIPGCEEEAVMMGPNGKDINLMEFYKNWSNDFQGQLLLSTYIKSVKVMCANKGVHCVQHILDCHDYNCLKHIKSLGMSISSPLSDYEFHARSFQRYITNHHYQKLINRITHLDLDFLPDGHFNEDTHKLWAHLYTKDIDRLTA
jgi:hypothetical protein